MVLYLCIRETNRRKYIRKSVIKVSDKAALENNDGGKKRVGTSDLCTCVASFSLTDFVMLVARTKLQGKFSLERR